jgi:hypothetical protein
MSRFVPLLALGTLLGLPAHLHSQVTATAPEAEAAQYAQRWDLFGGAQYMHFNPGIGNGDGIKANGLQGWAGSATAWFRQSWGIEASARGAYGNMTVPANIYSVPSSAAMSEHLFLFGPSFRMYRTTKLTLGMHTLIGAAYGKFSTDFPAAVMPQQVDIYNDKLAFGYVAGGYADFNLTPRVSIRAIADWQPTHYGYSQQNEFAGSVGIVYKMGALHK